MLAVGGFCLLQLPSDWGHSPSILLVPPSGCQTQYSVLPGREAGHSVYLLYLGILIQTSEGSGKHNLNWSQRRLHLLTDSEATSADSMGWKSGCSSLRGRVAQLERPFWCEPSSHVSVPHESNTSVCVTAVLLLSWVSGKSDPEKVSISLMFGTA